MYVKTKDKGLLYRYTYSGDIHSDGSKSMSICISTEDVAWLKKDVFTVRENPTIIVNHEVIKNHFMVQVTGYNISGRHGAPIG